MNTAVADLKRTDNSALKRKFFKYLIPSVASMWVYSIYTMVDGIFVGRGVGPTALASVNLAMPFINLIFATSILFATGASTLIAINLGKNKFDEANKIFTVTLLTILGFSILVILVSYFNLEKLCLALGATENTLPYVKDYLKIILLFNGFFMISYYLEVLTKTGGFPHLSIIGVCLSAATNIILDYIFVINLDLGIKGAAYATGISQSVATLFFIYNFTRNKSKLKLIKTKFNINILKNIFSIGFPDFLTELTSGIVILIFNSSILIYIGEIGLITYSVISYSSILVLMTMIGITQGVQPLSSYYYGKKDFKSIKYLFTLALKSIASASTFIFIISLTATAFIVQGFISPDDIEIFNYTISSFKIFSISFLIIGFNILISGFLSSLTKPLFATIISISRGFVLVLASLYITTHFLGGDGIWFTPIISEGLTVFISIFLLKISFSKNPGIFNK